MNYKEIMAKAKAAAFYLITGLIISFVTVYYYNIAQSGVVALAVFLFAVILISINPFYVLVFFALWLPLQNFAAMCSVGLLKIPYGAVKTSVAAKEIVAFLLLAYLFLKGKINIFKFKFVDFCFFLYFLWNTVYLVLPGDFFPVPADIISRAMGYRTAVVPVVLYFIGRFVMIDKRRILLLIKTVIIVAVFASIFGIIENRFFQDSFWFKAGIGEYEGLKTRGDGLPYGVMPGSFYSKFGEYYLKRLASTYVGSLAFGFAHIFVIALLISVMGSDKKTAAFKSIFDRIFTITVIIIAQLLTVTRAAIIANILGAGIFLLYTKKVKLKIILYFMPLILFLALSPLSRKVIEYTSKSKDGSTIVHIREIKSGYENFRKYPMGVGLGCAGAVGRAYNVSFAGENLYFTIGVERGIVGLTLFILASLALIRFSHKNRKLGRDEPLLFVLIYTTIISTIGYMVASITTEHWQAFVSSGVYWIFAGLTVQAIVKYKKFGEI